MQHKIYALFDFDLNQKKGYSIDQFLNLPKVKQAPLLQYRDKSNSFDKKLENIIYLKERFNGKLIVNDELELAKYADGLHVGQDDVLRYETTIEKSILRLRMLLKDKILGLSTHNVAEIMIANKLLLDYVGLGAYRKTNTKNVKDILSNNISTIASVSKHDVCGIGGVKSTDKIPHVKYLVLGSNLYEN